MDALIALNRRALRLHFRLYAVLIEVAASQYDEFRLSVVTAGTGAGKHQLIDVPARIKAGLLNHFLKAFVLGIHVLKHVLTELGASSLIQPNPSNQLRPGGNKSKQSGIDSPETRKGSGKKKHGDW